MDELFEIIKNLNRLNEKVSTLAEKFDTLLEVGDKRKIPQHSYLEKDEAAKILHVGKRTLEKMVAEGSVPCTRIRKRSLFLMSDLEELLKKNRAH